MKEKKIEEKIEQIARDAEAKIRELGKQLEERNLEQRIKEAAERVESSIARKLEAQKKRHSYRRSTEFWGVILLIMGFFFLAENLRWIRWDVEIWPLALIIFGAYLIYSGVHRE